MIAARRRFGLLYASTADDQPILCRSSSWPLSNSELRADLEEHELVCHYTELGQLECDCDGRVAAARSAVRDLEAKAMTLVHANRDLVKLVGVYESLRTARATGQLTGVVVSPS